MQTIVDVEGQGSTTGRRGLGAALRPRTGPYNVVTEKRPIPLRGPIKKGTSTMSSYDVVDQLVSEGHVRFSIGWEWMRSFVAGRRGDHHLCDPTGAHDSHCLGISFLGTGQK